MPGKAIWSKIQVSTLKNFSLRPHHRGAYGCHYTHGKSISTINGTPQKWLHEALNMVCKSITLSKYSRSCWPRMNDKNSCLPSKRYFIIMACNIGFKITSLYMQVIWNDATKWILVKGSYWLKNYAFKV